MALLVTPGREWVAGEVVTASKLNEASSGSVLDGQSFAFEAGSAATPPIAFSSDSNTGLYNPSSDALGFVNGGTESVRISAAGNVGVGTVTPQSKIHAHASTADAVSVQITNSTTGSASGDGLKVGMTSTGEALIDQQENQALTIRLNGTDRLKISTAGNVGIATGSPTEKLDVTGNIKASGSVISSAGTLGSLGCRAVTIGTGAPSGGNDGDVHLQYDA